MGANSTSGVVDDHLPMIVLLLVKENERAKSSLPRYPLLLPSSPPLTLGNGLTERQSINEEKE